MLVNDAERTISVEELGYECAQNSADIAPSARLSVINAMVDSTERKVTLNCCRQQVGDESKLDIIREIVNY